MMNDRESRDAELSAALQALPLPTTTSNQQQRVRGQIRANIVQQRAVAGLRAAAVLLVLAVSFQIWSNSANQTAPATDLSAAELNFLFAPPPVDSLAVLDQQQQVSYRTLQRWESNR